MTDRILTEPMALLAILSSPVWGSLFLVGLGLGALALHCTGPTLTRRVGELEMRVDAL